MGPRSRERGKIVAMLQRIVRWSYVASMGPRSRERGKRLSDLTLSTGYVLLQWGRAHVSAESVPPSRSVPLGGRVLLQWGRAHVSAESASVRSRRMRRSRFNGAALT